MFFGTPFKCAGGQNTCFRERAGIRWIKRVCQVQRGVPVKKENEIQMQSSFTGKALNLFSDFLFCASPETIAC